MMSEREWNYNHSGSAEPMGISMDTIFFAWIDYKKMMSWN